MSRLVSQQRAVFIHPLQLRTHSGLHIYFYLYYPSKSETGHVVQTIRLWGWDRPKVWGIAKLESMCWRSSNVRDVKSFQVCEGLDGIRDVDSGDSSCWSSTETVISIITFNPQPPSQQTWPHTAVCNGLHAKNASLSCSDSIWFECMEFCLVKCAIFTGIFADLCL